MGIGQILKKLISLKCILILLHLCQISNLAIPIIFGDTLYIMGSILLENFGLVERYRVRLLPTCLHSFSPPPSKIHSDLVVDPIPTILSPHHSLTQ